MARAHSQGQLICWDEDDDHGIEDIGSEDKGQGMTDSSDSFICINEEDGINEEDSVKDEDVNKDSKETVIEKDPSPAQEGDDGSDWEKWDDDDA